MRAIPRTLADTCRHQSTYLATWRVGILRSIWRWLNSPDIFLDIDWEIEQEPEVAAWFDATGRASLGYVAFQTDRLLFAGSMLRMPHQRALGDGLNELRFDLDTIAWRITYFFTEQRRIVPLTGVPQTTQQRTPRGESWPTQQRHAVSQKATLQTRNR